MLPLFIPNLSAPPDSLRPQVHWTPPKYRMTKEVIDAAPRVTVLHAGPRSDELEPETDDLPNSCFFEQVRNSQYIRMAVLEAVLT
jgi:aspartate carbamoyltransferase catalytic subunit